MKNPLKLFSVLFVAGLMLSSAASAWAMKPDDADKKKDRPQRPAVTRGPDRPNRDAARSNPPVVRPQVRRETPKPPVVRTEPRREIPKPPPVAFRPATSPNRPVALDDPAKNDLRRRDTPKVDRPKFNPPKVDTPRANLPQRNPNKVDTPNPGTPRIERPRFEAPKVDTPRANLPQRNPNKVDTPNPSTPRTERPRFEAPKVDTPRANLPQRNPNKVDTPNPGTPRTERPRFEAPKVDTPKVDKPNSDLPPAIKRPPVEFKGGAPKVDRQPNAGETDAERLRNRGFSNRPRPNMPKLGEPRTPGTGNPNTPKIGVKPSDKPLDLQPGRNKPGTGRPGITNPSIVKPGGLVPGGIPGGVRHPGEGPRRGDDRGLVGRPPLNPADAAKHNFAERIKSGDIDHLTKGRLAEQVGLRDQYKMYPQGDIARRMDLEKHLDRMRASNVVNVHIDNNLLNIYHHDRPYYHGVIAPNYTRDCFRYNYFGPHFYAGVCWYPNWLGWVDWSWNHHCYPIYDPRPIWCRPVIYEPAPVWVYYQVPVWQPLPTVACGTWVDVQPEVVKEKHDLQMLAVRFVDPGHPGEKLGPRYRVWFRNNSDKPITEPFDITVFAANDEKLVQGLPQAGVRVTAMDAGDTQSVDIRLPVESLTFGKDEEGKPGPFAAVHVIVDSNREIEDINRENNGVCLKTGDVLPVDPAAFGAKPDSAAAGDELVVAGEGFGPLPGQVIVRMGDLEFDAEILGWYDLGVRFTLPKVPLAKETEAEVIVIRGDSAAANPVKISILPPGAVQPAAPVDAGPRLQ